MVPHVEKARGDRSSHGKRMLENPVIVTSWNGECPGRHTTAIGAGHVAGNLTPRLISLIISEFLIFDFDFEIPKLRREVA